jgi:hypothetical protein
MKNAPRRNSWGRSMKIISFIKDFAALGLFAAGTYAWLVVA